METALPEKNNGRPQSVKGVAFPIFHSIIAASLWPIPTFLAWAVPLLAMFVAVSFLSLTNQELEDSALPKGKGAVVTTVLGTHLLGSVTNLSVLFVFGDRLQKLSRTGYPR